MLIRRNLLITGINLPLLSSCQSSYSSDTQKAKPECEYVPNAGISCELKKFYSKMPKEINIGTLVGGALGTGVYIAMVGTGPGILLAAFAGAVTGASVGFLVKAEKEYIDYKLMQVENNTMFANKIISQGIRNDISSFVSLHTLLGRKINHVLYLQSSGNSSLTQLRRAVQEIRNNQPNIDLEEKRGSISTNIYDYARNRTQNKPF